MNIVSHGINFHYFHDKDNYLKCQGSLTADELEKLIIFIKRKSSLLNADEYLDAFRKNRLKGNEVCLTFDDGVKSQLIAADVIKQFGLTAFFFVNTGYFDGDYPKVEIYHDFRFLKYETVDDFYDDFFALYRLKSEEYDVERFEMIDSSAYLPNSPWHTPNDRLFRYIRDVILGQKKYDNLMELLMLKKKYFLAERIDRLWLNENDLKSISDCGNIIGMHTHTHPTTINTMPYENQKKEYEKNYHFITRIIGESPCTMSHPSGKYNKAVVNNILDELGISLGFQAHITGSISKYCMPRLNHTEVLKEMDNNI